MMIPERDYKQSQTRNSWLASLTHNKITDNIS
jgi:hypothetical protein